MWTSARALIEPVFSRSGRDARRAWIRRPAGANLRPMADKEGTIHLERYTNDAKHLVAGAQQLADERGHSEVTPLHLLMRLLERDRGVVEVFRRAGADPSEVLQLSE